MRWLLTGLLLISFSAFCFKQESDWSYLSNEQAFELHQKLLTAVQSLDRYPEKKETSYFSFFPKAYAQTHFQSEFDNCISNGWIDGLCSSLKENLEYEPMPRSFCFSLNEVRCHPLLFGNAECLPIQQNDPFGTCFRANQNQILRHVENLKVDPELRKDYLGYVDAIQQLCAKNLTSDCYSLITYLDDLNRMVLKQNSCYSKDEFSQLATVNSKLENFLQDWSPFTPIPTSGKDRDYFHVSKEQMIKNKKSIVRGAHEIFYGTNLNCDIGNYGIGIKNYQVAGKVVPQLDFLKATLPTQPKECQIGKFERSAYTYGGKPIIPNDNKQTVRPERWRDYNGYSTANKLDCSGFISMSLMMVGAKWRKNQNNTQVDDYLAGTGYIGYLPKDQRNTCFGYATPTQYNPIEAGDIINFSDFHTVMVDSAGSDPFGLKKVRSISDCSRMTNENFDFTIIHSATDQNRSDLFGSGVYRVDGKALIGSLKYKIILLARQTCQTKFKADLQVQDRLWVGSNKGKTVRASVLRHKSNDPDCFYKPPFDLYNNKECAKACLERIDNG